MEQEFFAKQKKMLEDARKSLQDTLQKFANKDKEVADNWETKFPDLGSTESGNAGEGSLDAEADEVEQYEAMLPVEHTLESRLEHIDKALDKIEKGTYGICSKCGQPIEKERLEILPEADTCMKCEKK